MQYNILCENTLDCLSNFEVSVIEALFRYLWRLNKVSLGRLFSKKADVALDTKSIHYCQGA